MWLNYDQTYREAVKDPNFLLWRKEGARHKADNIVAVCREICHDSVIEIGCGTGAILRELANRKFAHSYVGTDVSAAALGLARKEVGREFRGGFVADAAALPLSGKVFSIAILSHVLEHLSEPDDAAREASRIAEFVVFEVPTEKVFTNWVRTRIFGRAYDSIATAGHVRFWSPKSFITFLRESCGFEVLALQRAAISKEEDLFGRKGFSRLKPLVKHALQSILPDFLRIRIFTTHTTALCRRAQRTAEHATLEATERLPAKTPGARHFHA